LYLQNEIGDQVGDVATYPESLIASSSDSRFICLGCIDPYGDTIFNRLQMKPLLKEIDLVSATAQSPEDKDAIARVERMAKRCQEDVHLYLRFIGD
jgi:hypothetical protein